jgi:hypothetical protein
MAWAHVQNATGGVPSSQSTLAITVNAITAGNLVVVAISANVSVTISSVSDGTANSYTQAYSKSINGSTANLYVWTATATNGGGTTITITASGSNNMAASVDEFSFSGGTVSVVTTAISNNTSGSTAPTTGTFTWAPAGNVLLYNAIGNSFAVSNLTQDPNSLLFGNQPLISGASNGVFTQGRLNTNNSGTSIGGTFSTSVPWASIGIAFSAGWSHIQSTLAPGGTNAVFSSNATVGNLVVVTVAYTGTLTGVSDGSNTYTLASSNTSGNVFSAIYYSVITVGGMLSVTISGSLTMPVMEIDEYSFTAGTISIPSTNSASANGVNPQGGYLTFNNQPALICSSVGNDTISSVLTPNTGYNITGQAGYSAGNFWGFNFMSYLNAFSSPQLPGGTFNNTVNWATTSAVFVSSGDTQQSLQSTPFSNIYSGNNNRLNPVHY